MVRSSFLALALVAFPLFADEARDAQPKLLESRPYLRALFERAPGVISHDENGLSVEGRATEVVLARIGSDGKPVRVCVDNEVAARRFLEAPADELGKGAREK